MIESQRTTVDSKQSWSMVTVLFFVLMLCHGFIRTFNVYVSRLLIDYGDYNIDKVSVFTAATSLSVGVGAIGILIIKWFGCRAALIIGGTLNSSAYIISSYIISSSAYPLYITYALLAGTGSGICLTATFFLITRRFSRNITTASSFVILGSSVGAFIWPYFINYLDDSFGIYGAMLIIGALILHIIPASFLIADETYYRQEELAKRDETPKPQTSDSSTSVYTPLEHSEEYKTHEISEKEHFGKTCRSEKDYLLLKSNSYYNTENSSFEIIKTVLAKTIQSVKKFLDIKKLFQKPLACMVVRKPTLCLYTISFVFSQCIQSTIVLIIPARGVEMILSEYVISLIVMEIGAGDVIARLTIGFVSDLRCMQGKRSIVYSACAFMLALMIYIHIVYYNPVTLHALSISYGLFGQVLWVFISPILVDDFGADEFPEAYAYITSFMIPIPILSGAIYQYLKTITNSWIWPLHLCAAQSVLSGVIALSILSHRYCRGKTQ